MTKIKRKWDIFSQQERNNLITQTIEYFKRERDENLGVIAAEKILDFYLESIVEKAYNHGVTDSKELLKNRFIDLDLDLEILLNK